MSAAISGRCERGPGFRCAHPGYRSDRHCERSEAIHFSACRGMDCFAALAMTVKHRSAQRPSYPANGSRECAPDDRLRRGIQYAAVYRFYHCCLWNTGSPACAGDDDWICVCDLAASLREFFQQPHPPKQRVQGMPGACCTRGLVCECVRRKCTRAYRYSRSNPAFPAQWFDGLCRALPGDEFLLPPSLPA
jgi:hypothetical protein